MPLAQQPCRVLVVDDHPVNRTLLVRLLRRSGFDLAQATNGIEAVTLWQQWQPHLILMDLMMPGLSGYEATHLIRSTEAFTQQPTTPIIALTAEDLPPLAHQLHTVGFDSLMIKPIRSDILFKLMARYLGLQYDHGNGLVPNHELSDQSCAIAI